MPSTLDAPGLDSTASRRPGVRWRRIDPERTTWQSTRWLAGYLTADESIDQMTYHLYTNARRSRARLLRWSRDETRWEAATVADQAEGEAVLDIYRAASRSQDAA